MASDSLPIPGFPDYRISRDGKVYSRRVYGSRTRRVSDEWWELKQKGNSVRRRHPYVDLFREVGKPERFFVHQLVMMAFVGPCPEGMIVCHKNDVADDNRLENLYYGTKATNNTDAVRNGRIKVGEDSWCATLTNDQVREIRRLCREGSTYAELAARFGKSKHYIYRIVTLEIWRHVT